MRAGRKFQSSGIISTNGSTAWQCQLKRFIVIGWKLFGRMKFPACCCVVARQIGLYRISRPVRKSGKFSKSGLSENRTFSFPDAGLSKIEKKIQFFSLFFLGYSYGKMFKKISPDSVWSGRTRLANLGVQSCPVRKLICPVWSSPSARTLEVNQMISS